MESTMADTPLELDEDSGSREHRRLTDVFAIVGPILQHSSQFFDEVRAGVQLGWKTRALSVTSVVFLAIYGAVLGSRYPLLSASAAIGIPILFTSSLITCIPVTYLLDILTGSRRSLAQMVVVLLIALCAAATVLFSFAPIVIVFNLTGSTPQFFVLNVGILGLATAVGLMFMVRGLIRTAIVDTSNDLSRINRRLHYVWVLLYLMVSIQIGQGLLSFYQESGGFLIVLIEQLSR